MITRLRGRATERDLLVLVNAPRARGEFAKATGFYPHLGIRAIEAYLAIELPGLVVECLDGEIRTRSEIDERLRRLALQPHRITVGFATILGNYGASLELATMFKCLRPDSVIVMGGPWAGELAETILATAACVDWVVRGDGEIPLKALLTESGEPPVAVGLVGRHQVGASSSERSIVPLADLPWPLARLDTLDPYHTNFANAWPTSSFRPVPLYFKKYGCDQRCPYCAIPSVPMRPRSPREALDEVLFLAERFGANHFWDISDNADVEFWEQFCLEMTRRKVRDELSFFTFISAERVTPRFVSAFQRAGGAKVFVGVDSGDTAVLRRLKAGRATAEDNLRALRLVKEAGLFLDCSIIMAPPGEDKESMQRTLAMVADQIAPYDRLTLLLAPVLTPLPGTHHWARYFGRHPTMRAKYLADPKTRRWVAPTWGVEELQRDYLACTTELAMGADDVFEGQAAIRALRPDVFSTWSD